MSLEILLEAAKYLEYRSEAKARGEEPSDYHTFSGDIVDNNIPPPKTNNHHHHHHHRHHKSGSHNNLNSNNHNYKIDLSQCSDRSPDYPFDPRDKRAGTREVHNKLEKNRRAHLKECFEMLKKQLPSMEERKTSNLSILRGALRYIQVLKRKEREYEHEMEKLAREKIASQQKLACLKKELSSQLDHIDISNFLPDQDNETTTTASECGIFTDAEYDEATRETTLPNPRSLSPDSASMSSSSSSESSDAENSNMDLPIVNPTISKNQTSPVLPATIMAPEQSKAPFIRSPTIHPTTPPNPQQALAKSVISHPKNEVQVKMSSSNQNLKIKQRLKSVPFKQSSIAHISTKSMQATQIQISAPVGPTANSIRISEMTGLVPSVQVINQGSGVKVIATTSTAINSGASGLLSQNGPVHIFSPASTIMAVNPNAPIGMVASNKTGASQHSLVKIPQTNQLTTSKGHLVNPVTLVAATTVMNVSQINNNNKPLYINQAIALPSNRTIIGKTNSTTNFGKTQNQAMTALGQITTSSNGIAYMQPKMASHILQAVSQKTLVSAAGQAPIASLGRPLIPTAIKPINQMHSIPQLSRITQLVPQSSMGHMVTTGTRVKPRLGRPRLSTPVSVVPARTVSQQQHGKVFTGNPMMKSRNAVPFIQQPVLQSVVTSTSPSTHNANVVKPVVMVSMASIGKPPSVPLKQ